MKTKYTISVLFSSFLFLFLVGPLVTSGQSSNPSLDLQDDPGFYQQKQSGQLQDDPSLRSQQQSAQLQDDPSLFPELKTDTNTAPARTTTDDNPRPQQSGTSIQLQNPLKVDSIEDFLRLVLNILLIFAVPIIVFFIIYSGFLYVKAQGKPDEIKRATQAFMWTVIGGVIVLGAWVILEVITGTVNSLR